MPASTALWIVLGLGFRCSLSFILHGLNRRED